MRTTSEIIAKIEKHKGDFFGFVAGDLMTFLPFKDAKPYLSDDVTKKSWKVIRQEDALDRLKEYMPFAWEKANNCRGLCASRSLEHMSAWLWMLGEEAAADEVGAYSLYGKPQLAAICEHYDIDWEKLDEGDWVDSENGPGRAKVIAKLTWAKAPAKKSKKGKK